MNSKLAVGLAFFIAGLATLLGGADSWSTVLSVRFVSAMLMQLSGFILSVWGGIETKPPRNGSKTRVTDLNNDNGLR